MKQKLERLFLGCCVASWTMTANPADAWIYYGGFGDGTQVESDAAGDIVACGRTSYTAALVVKIDGASGAELWRWTGGGSQHVLLAIDDAGDVIVFVRFSAQWQGHHVLKLDGDSGAVVWDVRYDTGSFPSGGSLALSPAGDAFVSFTQYGGSIAHQHLVIKLAGASGAELWRYLAASIPNGLVSVGDDVLHRTGSAVRRLNGADGSESWQWDGDSIHEMVADAAGNALVVAGQDPDPETVFKLSGADGAELWSHPLPSEVFVFDQAVDAADHLVAVGQAGGLDTFAYAVKLDIATGDELWSTVDTSATESLAHAVAVNGFGQAYVAGYVGPPNSRDFRVWKQSAGNGASLWVRDLAGVGGSSEDSAFDVTVTPSGDPVIAGELASTFAVIKLDAAGGDCSGTSCPETLDIGVIKIGEKFRKRWLWGIKASGSPLSLPSPLSASDPVRAGVSIELSNPTTGERAAFELPAGANWTYLGTTGAAPGDKGYLYQDKEGRNGPCTQLKMVPGKTLTLTCQTGATRLDPPFTLDEAAQGSLRVHLQMGAFQYCLSTEGGTLVKDRAAVEGGPRGLFKVKNAPAPASCP